MADNVKVTQGVGTTFITEDVGAGNQIAVTKMAYGDHGAYTDVSISDPLPVEVTDLVNTQGSTTSGQSGPLIQGAVTIATPTYTDATTAPISLTADGAVRTDSSNTTQPMSATSLPLPTGAATSTLQSTANTSLASIDGKITSCNTGAVVIASGSVSVSAGTVSVSNFPATQPISATALPLPTGAATSANQTSELTKLDTLHTDITSSQVRTIAAGTAVIGKVGIDQTTPGTTNLVSIGTNGTVAINAAIPAGANTIGAVTQASGPWTQNVTQVGGSSLALGQTTMSASIPVALASNQSVITVGGTTSLVLASYTRQGNTTTYATGQALSDSASSPTALSFSNCARVSGGSGVILNAMLVDESAPGTRGSFELWVFDTSPTATNDLATFAVTNANAKTLVGIIPFTTSYTNSTNTLYMGDKVNLPFKCSATTLYGLVVVRNSYTPASSGVLDFRLQIAQD